MNIDQRMMIFDLIPMLLHSKIPALPAGRLSFKHDVDSVSAELGATYAMHATPCCSQFLF